MNYIEFLQQRAFSEGYTQRMFDEAAAAEGEKAAEGFLSKLGKKVKATWNADAAEGSGNFLSKSKIGNRAAIIGIPTLTAAGIGYGVYRHKKKKREAAAAAAAEALEEAAEAQKEYSNYLDYRMYSDDDEPEEAVQNTSNKKLGAAALAATLGTGAGMYGLSKYEGRGAMSKIGSFFTGKSKKQKAQDFLEKVGDKIRDAWGTGKGLEGFKKNAKGRAALAALALGTGATVYGAGKGISALKNRRKNDED